MHEIDDKELECATGGTGDGAAYHDLEDCCGQFKQNLKFPQANCCASCVHRKSNIIAAIKGKIICELGN